MTHIIVNIFRSLPQHISSSIIVGRYKISSQVIKKLRRRLLTRFDHVRVKQNSMIFPRVLFFLLKSQDFVMEKMTSDSSATWNPVICQMFWWHSFIQCPSGHVNIPHSSWEFSGIFPLKICKLNQNNQLLT